MESYLNLVNQIKDKIDISKSKQILINEAITEISAVIVNCILCSIESNLGFSEFIEYLNLERKYSLFQSFKLKFYYILGIKLRMIFLILKKKSIYLVSQHLYFHIF